MKIEVRYLASQHERRETFTLEDLGHTQEEWDAMTKYQKRRSLMTAVETEPPYWYAEQYEEVEN